MVDCEGIAKDRRGFWMEVGKGIEAGFKSLTKVEAGLERVLQGREGGRARRDLARIGCIGGDLYSIAERWRELQRILKRLKSFLRNERVFR